MRFNLFAILALLAVTTAFGAESNAPALIPVPQKMELSKGEFTLGPATYIEVDNASVATGEYLAAKLRSSTGYRLVISTNERSDVLKGTIRLRTVGAKTDLGAEGYELNVGPDVVSISASTQAGLFYGVQTLLQLFPPQIFASAPATNVAWKIPYAVHIEDQPRFQWRGFMLDCSRHFFSKDEVKRVLDEMASQKLNMFHWHLTDDQGWRIEIKKYPKLTQVGAWRKQSLITPPVDDDGNHTEDHVHPVWDVAPPTAFGPDGRYGGFYSQDDVREVVAYAATLHITVVPEIEMPGHAIAALASYPQMGCGGDFSVDVNAGVNNGVFCIGDDKVIQFLQDILLEVFPLFSGKYVHVGGDEVSDGAKKASWGQSPACQARMKAEGLKTLDELQGWFTGQMGKFVDAHGKTLLGWSEIADAKLPQNAAVMDWIGGATHSATNGHDVVMAPTRNCYIDYYQSLDTAAEPPGIGGFMPLEKVYAFDPIPKDLPSAFQARILGGQCNLWTEYIPSLAHVEYMMFPRLCALAEVGWSAKSSHDWNDFTQRLQTHEQRLEQMGVNYRRDLSVKIGEWTPAQLSAGSAGTNLEWDVTSQVKAAGQYRITFQYTQGAGMNLKSVALLENGKEVVTDGHAGFAARNPSKPVYVLNLPAVNAGAKYSVRASVAGGKSSGVITSLFKSPVNKP